ncbi:MliC family protein [Pseudoxanthomonas suwonensis]|uniref:MliC family protein n=1 Tax=Pseudoxanthomonas suwonensis TaxID=314722 RepID=UPI0004AE3D43|nr:MliC family protein [Pseudoxanthomonas suwonensis]
MRKMLQGTALVAGGLAVLLLAACRPDTPEATPAETAAASAQDAAPQPAAGEATLDPAAPPPGATAEATAAVVNTHWQCGDQRVAVRFDNAAQTVTVVHDRGEMVLPQEVAASGARYADTNGNEFWTKGPSATLTLSGTPARECSEIGANGTP